MQGTPSVDRPSPNRTNGEETRPVVRDAATGRYLPGHGGGPGNPLGRHVHKLRGTLLDLLLAGDAAQMRGVWGTMIRKATKGDVAAARLVAEYSIGKPALAISVENETGPLYKIICNIDESML